MASLESRLTALETQAGAEDTNRVILYEPGEELPELPAGDDVFIRLPDNHREATHAA